MPLPNANRSETITQSSWELGMITSLPPEEIPDGGAVDILNFYFDDIGNLVARPPSLLFATPTQTAAYTSIFVANYSNGTTTIYFTAGTKLYKMTSGGASITDITGAFTFPNGNRWYWVMFNDYAIGVNGSSTAGQNPIKIDSAGTVTHLNASAPLSSHCEVWNNRLWLSGIGSNQNKIYGSAINDPTDWTVDDDSGAITLGIDIGDGDAIKALKVFRGNLIVYKGLKINIVSAISAPATIPNNLRVDLYTDNVGCPYPATIQNVLDDQVFLGQNGVVSLTLAPLGETKGSLLSRQIPEIKAPNIYATQAIASSATAVVLHSRQQYLLSIPAAISYGGSAPTTSNDTVWVLDYSQITEKDDRGFPKVRWCRFDGDYFGTCYAMLPGTSTFYLIGRQVVAATNTPFYYIQPPEFIISYTGTVSKRILTRAFNGQSPTIRSLWHRFGITFKKLTNTVGIAINYYFDNYLTAAAGSYTHSSDNTIPNTHRTYWRRFKNNDSGRKANLVQLEIIANTANQGITIKSISLEKTPLNYRRAKTGWVSD